MLFFVVLVFCSQREKKVQNRVAILPVYIPNLGENARMGNSGRNNRKLVRVKTRVVRNEIGNDGIRNKYVPNKVSNKKPDDNPTKNEALPDKKEDSDDQYKLPRNSFLSEKKEEVDKNINLDNPTKKEALPDKKKDADKNQSSDNQYKLPRNSILSDKKEELDKSSDYQYKLPKSSSLSDKFPLPKQDSYRLPKIEAPKLSNDENEQKIKKLQEEALKNDLERRNKEEKLTQTQQQLEEKIKKLTEKYDKNIKEEPQITIKDSVFVSGDLNSNIEKEPENTLKNENIKLKKEISDLQNKLMNNFPVKMPISQPPRIKDLKGKNRYLDYNTFNSSTKNNFNQSVKNNPDSDKITDKINMLENFYDRKPDDEPKVELLENDTKENKIEIAKPYQMSFKFKTSDMVSNEENSTEENSKPRTRKKLFNKIFISKKNIEDRDIKIISAEDLETDEEKIKKGLEMVKNARGESLKKIVQKEKKEISRLELEIAKLDDKITKQKQKIANSRNREKKLDMDLGNWHNNVKNLEFAERETTEKLEKIRAESRILNNEMLKLSRELDNKKVIFEGVNDTVNLHNKRMEEIANQVKFKKNEDKKVNFQKRQIENEIENQEKILNFEKNERERLLGEKEDFVLKKNRHELENDDDFNVF